MAIAVRRPVVLEPASREFVDATSTPPFIYELSPAEARKVLDDVQAAPIEMLRVDERWITVRRRGRARANRDAARGDGDAGGNPLHAWWRLGPWECRHP